MKAEEDGDKEGTCHCLLLRWDTMRIKGNDHGKSPLLHRYVNANKSWFSYTPLNCVKQAKLVHMCLISLLSFFIKQGNLPISEAYRT